MSNQIAELNAAYSINDARVELGNMSRDKVYRLIRSGELEARKSGGRTLILGASISDFLNSLPSLEVA